MLKRLYECPTVDDVVVKSGEYWMSNDERGKEPTS
jgi:hypothetical protein